MNRGGRPSRPRAAFGGRGRGSFRGMSARDHSSRGRDAGRGSYRSRGIQSDTSLRGGNRYETGRIKEAPLQFAARDFISRPARDYRPSGSYSPPLSLDKDIRNRRDFGPVRDRSYDRFGSNSAYRSPDREMLSRDFGSSRPMDYPESRDYPSLRDYPRTSDLDYMSNNRRFDARDFSGRPRIDMSPPLSSRRDMDVFPSSRGYGGQGFMTAARSRQRSPIGGFARTASSPIGGFARRGPSPPREDHFKDRFVRRASPSFDVGGPPMKRMRGGSTNFRNMRSRGPRGGGPPRRF